MSHRLATGTFLAALILAGIFLLVGVWPPLPLDPALAEPQWPRTTMVAVGDILLGRKLGLMMEEADDFTLPLTDIAEPLRSATIAVGNLEGPLCPKPPFTRRGMVFRVNPRGVETLLFAGFDVVTLANNHAYDGGPRCLSFTLDHLRAHGILRAGAGKTYEEAHTEEILERNGVRFAFLGYTFAVHNDYPGSRLPVVAGRDPASLHRDVARARKNADVVIVMLHDGSEYTRNVARVTRRFSRAAIDAGASVVLGHHPHVVQRVEHYRNGWIFYSLGNFVFEQYNPGAREALMARLTFRGTFLEKVEALPVYIDSFAHPRLATEEESRAILDAINLSDALLWPAPVRSPRSRRR